MAYITLKKSQGWSMNSKSNQGMWNVRPTCDATVTATEAIKVFKK